MWELDHKEGWAPKNWCFWTLVLEKTLESPLDCKETKPVNPKGNQPWIFIGRTDAEAEVPILWPRDAKSWLIGKDPDAGKDWRQKEKGVAEDERASPTSEAYPNSCPLSWWCHSIISSSVVPFSSCLQSFPASGSLQMSQFFTSGGQSIGASVSASVLAMNIQYWFPLGLTALILQSKGPSRDFSNTIVWKHQFFGTQLSLWSNSHIYTWLLEKS